MWIAAVFNGAAKRSPGDWVAPCHCAARRFFGGLELQAATNKKFEIPFAFRVQNQSRVLPAGVYTRELFWEAYDAEVERLKSLPTGGRGDFYLTLGARVGKRFSRALVTSTIEGRSSFTDAFRLLGFKKMSTFRSLCQDLGLRF